MLLLWFFFFFFVCSIFAYQQSPQPPQYIYWQRNDRMVNYDDNRRDISIDTIPGPRTQSRLIIKEPQITDSGNYTCRASNTEPASIFVYVSKGNIFYLFICFRTFSFDLNSLMRKYKQTKKHFNSQPLSY